MRKDSESETAKFIEAEIDSGYKPVAQEDASEGGSCLSSAAWPCPDLQHSGPDPMVYRTLAVH